MFKSSPRKEKNQHLGVNVLHKTRLFGHFTLLFPKERQRNVPTSIARVQSYIVLLIKLLFCDVLAAVAFVAA